MADFASGSASAAACEGIGGAVAGHHLADLVFQTDGGEVLRGEPENIGAEDVRWKMGDSFTGG